MAEVRVYELAKEFGVQSKDVFNWLQETGEFVRSASSVVPEPAVRRLREWFAAQAGGVTPSAAVNDIASEEDFLAAIDETITYFHDGDILGSEPAEPWRPAGPASEAPQSGKVLELLASWDSLRKLVPADHRCADPGENGWPGLHDVDTAVATARE